MNINISDDSFVEPEEGNDNLTIKIPFNPDDINIKIIPRNIGQLVELLEDKQVLIPKYQRLPNLWSDKNKSRFIESLMLDLPIPLFYFDEGEEKKWNVVDGLQRMSTLEHFILGKGFIGNNKTKLILQDLEFLVEFNGKTWDDLPKDIKRRISSNQVTINLIGKGTPDEVKYTIFSRINQGGVPLKPQEIRTALFQGYRIDFLESLISEKNEVGALFRKVTNGSIKSNRQEDLDFISRFISFYLQDYSKYEPDMDRFITIGTNLIPNDIDKLEKIRLDFTKSMNLCWDIFSIDAFRKRIGINDTLKPINKPIFEVVSTTFAKLGEEDIKILKATAQIFRLKFIDFQNENTKFWGSITSATASKDSVNNRHNAFNEFLKTFLSDKSNRD